MARASTVCLMIASYRCSLVPARRVSGVKRLVRRRGCRLISNHSSTTWIKIFELAWQPETWPEHHLDHSPICLRLALQSRLRTVHDGQDLCAALLPAH